MHLYLLQEAGTVGGKWELRAKESRDENGTVCDSEVYYDRLSINASWNAPDGLIVRRGLFSAD